MNETQCASWGKQVKITLKDKMQERDFLPK